MATRITPLFFGDLASMQRTIAVLCESNHSNKQSASLPVSRELVRMIRTSSQLQGAGHALGEHLQVVDAWQAKAVEFYLRACALRLDQGL